MNMLSDVFMIRTAFTADTIINLKRKEKKRKEKEKKPNTYSIAFQKNMNMNNNNKTRSKTIIYLIRYVFIQLTKNETDRSISSGLYFHLVSNACTGITK